MRMQDDAVRVCARLAGLLRSERRATLGDLTRIRNAPGRQQGLHVPMDRGLDVASHASSSQAAAAVGDPLIALTSCAVVRISCA
jgi:hypothetical protein